MVLIQVTAIYPGTFDPMTVGHVDVAHRASKMFDDLIIAVAANPNKGPFFTLEERVDMSREILSDLPNVTVQPFDGLLVEFADQVSADVIVRGLRAISDFEYEVQIAAVNRHLSPNVETVFIAASQDYTFLSSSIVREIASHGGEFAEFVHPLVVDAFAKKRKA
jgi:pantetheine-phosphate adenylyltransferase